MRAFLIAAAWLAATVAYAQVQVNLADDLQEVSVTIDTRGSQGSGVIVTREVPSGDKTEKISFVWTAAHVVRGLRDTRELIDRSGQKRTAVEFRDASIVKELIEEGRRVGEITMDAQVIRYSDADNGHDLALLMVRKRDFVDVSAAFYDDEPEIIPPGTKVLHVGSLLGQDGANSLTSGIVSQVGRVLQLGGGGGTVFDQTTSPAFPGSSGGGMFLDPEGRCIGLLVRGAGETFNLIVPIRRMRDWAGEVGITWALDADAEVPQLKDILKAPVEDAGFAGGGGDAAESAPDPAFKFLIAEPGGAE